MVKRTGPTNTSLQKLISQLRTKANEVALWKRIASDLEKPSRQRRSVNLYKINNVAKDGETIIVPGKVLSIGDIDKKITIAAFSYSSLAKQKISKNGSALTIKELFEKNPQGKGIRIIG
ncbi:50S ribosomal protein L18e [archaeon]|jgi:large subunit ribosomal protein L18e|nr:50S ribosomal protein L18e [archaeon]MBT6698417.1 50S ribosomal protein L18e [archaeon]